MSHTESEPVVEEDPTATDAESKSGIRWLMVVTAGIMALVIGALAAWATANLGISAITFVVATAASGYYLYTKPLPSAALGTGLYISAVLLVLTPIVFYLPVVLGAEAETAEGAGAFLGGIAGLIIWGFVFFLIAIVVFVIGYFINRRARKKLAARE